MHAGEYCRRLHGASDPFRAGAARVKRFTQDDAMTQLQPQTQPQPTPQAMPAPGVKPAPDAAGIRPFRVDVPETELVELRRRINATRWPDRETVADASEGIQLAMIQKLARYWGSEYDWRPCEARLN